MSSITETTEADTCCANCGAAEVDDIKLEKCTDCDLVKYCSEWCLEQHREQHEEECKSRVKDLHDKKLFTQPDGTNHGECPLCFLPLPIARSKTMFLTCCSETICNGCVYAIAISNEENRCPFCRELADDDENDKRLMERVKSNDPVALRYVGMKCRDEGDYNAAFEYFTKAAGLGDIDAYYELACLYEKGEGVEKDLEKQVYHSEQAAIGGHPFARNNLGFIEHENGNFERAAKHFIIAANLGYEISMKSLWKYYSAGHITKKDLDATLRTHQAALDEMKSKQRDKAEASGVF